MDWCGSDGDGCGWVRGCGLGKEGKEVAWRERSVGLGYEGRGRGG
jgi:hypothetical protein